MLVTLSCLILIDCIIHPAPDALGATAVRDNKSGCVIIGTLHANDVEQIGVSLFLTRVCEACA